MPSMPAQGRNWQRANLKPSKFFSWPSYAACDARRLTTCYGAFDFSRCLLHIENTEYYQRKSEDSAGEIDLDADTAALFKSFRARAPKSLFDIESPNAPRAERKARCYRCNAVFECVNEWLRIQGVDTMKPLHTMRKDIRITSAIYADKKKTVTPKAFAGLLTSTENVILADFKTVKTTTTSQRKVHGA